MLERLTRMLNVVTMLSLVTTGIYVLAVFDDLFSMEARAVLIIGLTVYSFKQLEVCAGQGNKN